MMRMDIANTLTNELVFRWNDSERKLLVLRAGDRSGPRVIAQIEWGTLDGMTWPDASRFIGEFVTLLVPALRTRYSSEFADATPQKL